MEKDFNNNFVPPFSDFNMNPNNMNMGFGYDMNDIYKDPMFNPIAQYEQAYIYYRYLCMQMDYKIKCKEYERMSNDLKSNSNYKDRKIE